MKVAYIILCLLFSACVFSQETGEIEINVTGINKKAGGDLFIAVYEKEGFPAMGKQVVEKVVEVISSEMNVELKEVPTGTYAVAVFQDKNTDQSLNKNMFGAPIELFGFSRNKKGRGGPPPFDEVSFVLNPGKRIKLTINLD